MELSRTVYRLALAVIVILLLALPALGDTNDPEVSSLKVSPDTVWVSDGDVEDIFFEAQISDLGSTEDVYLTLLKDASSEIKAVTLDYDRNGLWKGEIRVDEDDIGTWKVINSYYGDHEGITLDDNNSDIETTFLVKESTNSDIIELDIHPETIIVTEDTDKTVYFDAAVDDLDEDAVVYLTFKKDGATTEVEAELEYDDGLWVGSKSVDEDDLGTWRLQEATYELDADDKTGDLDFNTDDPDIDTRFVVKKAAEDDDDGDDNPNTSPVNGILKLRAMVDYDDGQAEDFNLYWSGDNDDVTIYVGYNAAWMVQVKEVDGSGCSLDADAVLDELKEMKWHNNKRNILFRVANENGVSNVAVVSLVQNKGPWHKYISGSCPLGSDNQLPPGLAKKNGKIHWQGIKA